MRVSRGTGAGQWGPRERAREGGAAGTKSPRILIVRLGSLGDLVHTLPAVSAIRRAWPHSEIDWLVEAPHREFLELVPVISSLVVLERRGAGAWIDAIRVMRRRHYAMAIDFQGLVKSASLARLSAATRVIGFDRAGVRESLATMFYSERADVAEGGHVVRKNLALAAAAGGTGEELEFPIRAVASPIVEEFVARDPRPFVLINPGAAWPNKRWLPDRFGAAARWVMESRGLPSVVLWGPGEQGAAEDVVRASGGAARLAPPTSLKDLVALARHAKLFVSGDTGPLHVASAVGTPTVSIFGPTNPMRNGPWETADVSVSLYESCPCHYQRQCRLGPGEWCLGRVTVEQVTGAIAQRLPG